MSDTTDLTSPEPQVPEGENYTTLMVSYLKNTRPWVTFLGILMIISSATLGLGAVYMFGLGACMGSRLSSFGMFSSLRSGGPLAGFVFLGGGVFYLVLAGLEIPLAVFLLRYARSIKALVSTGRTANLEEALLNQQKYWKFNGILAIVGLAVATLAITVFVIVVIAMATRAF
jgi:hypothetical protein